MLKDIIPEYRKHEGYELFGIDMMLDRSLNLYILGVNIDPNLLLNSSLNIVKQTEQLLDDTFKLTIDKTFKINTKDSRYILLKQY